MDMSKIGRNEWFAIGGTVVVVLGVLIGPWYTISFGPISASASAWDINAGGKLAFLAMLVMIAAVVIKFLPNPPELPVSADVILLVAAAVVLVMAVIDFLMHSGHAGWGIYVSIIGAILAGFGAFASGARLSMPTSTGTGTGTGTGSGTGAGTGAGPSSEA